MPKRIELRDGVLGEVVEEFHPIAEQGRELEQLQAIFDDAKTAYDNAVTALGLTENNAELLGAAAQARDEARAAFEESKSNFDRGVELVGQPSDAPASEPTDESGGTPVGVTVADQDPQY